MSDRDDQPDAKRILAYSVFLAIGIEAVTVCFRFGMGWQATRDTSWLSQFTLGLRIHHGYIGLVLLLAAVRFTTPWRQVLLILGLGLAMSDLAHHFLVLWPITGSPQFDLWYGR